MKKISGSFKDGAVRKRIHIIADDELLSRLDEYAYNNRFSRSLAVYRLLSHALDSIGKEKL